MHCSIYVHVQCFLISSKDNERVGERERNLVRIRYRFIDYNSLLRELVASMPNISIQPLNWWIFTIVNTLSIFFSSWMILWKLWLSAVKEWNKRFEMYANSMVCTSGSTDNSNQVSVWVNKRWLFVVNVFLCTLDLVFSVIIFIVRPFRNFIHIKSFVRTFTHVHTCSHMHIHIHIHTRIEISTYINETKWNKTYSMFIFVSCERI